MRFLPYKSLTLVSLWIVTSATGFYQGRDLSSPTITKVEPPSWWANHTFNPVRVLMRGSHLRGAHVISLRPEIVPSVTVINNAATYLFVSLKLDPASKPGHFPLLVQTPAGKTIVSFRLEKPRNPEMNFQGINNDDVIYLIMPDRFANGDPSNDVPPDAPPTATDRNNRRAYHGGDLRGIINKLPYLKELGVTALWLNPWYDNWNGLYACDKSWCPTTYYHGYHAIDYYAVEDRFGNLETLQEFVSKAHALGLKVVQDQVANHVGLHHPWVNDPPLGTWFHPHQVNRPFRADLLLSPHADPVSRQLMLDGWFSDELPDLNQDEPEVATYEIQNALWWVGVTGLDGIRQDTAQYMPRTFIRDLSVALHRQYPKLWIVGEVFNRDPAHTSFFVGGNTGWDGIDTGLNSVFDFPLWQTSVEVFTNKKPVQALRDMLKYDGLYPDPSRLTTMVGNHDVPRFLSREGATLEDAMLHVAFTLTVRGTPQLYYGDEIAMEGADGPDNRRDFPGGFPGDNRNAFQPEGRSSREAQIYQWTRDWLRLRREHPALRRGDLIDLFFDDDSYVYARQLGDELVVIAINRTPLEKEISARVPPGAPENAKLVPLLVAKNLVQVLNGTMVFTVPPRTAVAYRLQKL